MIGLSHDVQIWLCAGFTDLRKGFELRGFYLDNQSLQQLVSFYERMGNVERMSDSGDAVYVRKTL